MGPHPLHKRAAILHEAARLMRQHWSPVADAPSSRRDRQARQGCQDGGDPLRRPRGLHRRGGRPSARPGKNPPQRLLPRRGAQQAVHGEQGTTRRRPVHPPVQLPRQPRRVEDWPRAHRGGNAVVVKPPTQGCVAGLHMAHCFLKAGVPPGLVNVVTGRGSEIGDYLTRTRGPTASPSPAATRT